MNKKIKTLLLNLPTNINDVSDYYGFLQPYGLAMISSFLKHRGCDVSLLDAQAYHIKREKIIRYIKEFKPRVLGLPLMTTGLPQTISFLKDVKKLNPEIIAVLGGPHPSIEYRSLLQNNREVDIVVIGEGEYTLLEIVENIQSAGPLDEVRGIAYRDKGQIKVNPFRDFIQDLDSLPFADWESLPMKEYWISWTVKKNYANMALSRGCPFGCTFCGAKKVLGQNQRKRSVEHILDEIKLLYDRYNVRNLFFSDSTLNIDNQWVNEICEGLLRLKRPLLWGCNIRADRVNKETLKLMKSSGCIDLFIGVESADNGMLKSMNKGESIEKIREGIKTIEEVGIDLALGFMIGMPGETEESIKKTIEFAKENKKCIVTFTLATPFPGTEFYEVAKREGLLLKDWEKFDTYAVAYIPQSLTKEKLEFYYKKAVKSTHLRPSYLLNRIFKVKSWTNFKANLKTAYLIFSKRFSNFRNHRIT